LQDLSGTVGVVTGGGDGIGRAGALRLAEQGMHLAILDIRENAAFETATLCADRGVRAIAVACDVTVAAGMDTAARRVRAELGPVKLVWANAGVVVRGGIITAAAADLEWLFRVNVDGAINTVRAFASDMIADSGWRRVALTCSSGGLAMSNRASAYSASKIAQLAIAEALRADFAESGIGVTVICPAAVNTRIWDGRRARPAQFGGALTIASTGPEAQANEASRSRYMDPDTVARAAVDGIRRGDFFTIVTDTFEQYRQKVRERAEELLRAVDAAETTARQHAQRRPGSSVID
jgi:NAD(P)-dependent dehydrogenase (short-subunit alcohol dehydrogenase family)